MSEIERDHRLQKHLESLERGVPLQEVLRRAERASPEEAALVELAAEIRSLEHPSPDPARARARQAQFSQAVKAYRQHRPAAIPTLFEGVVMSIKTAFSRTKRFPAFLPVALAGIALFGAVALVALALLFAGSARAQTVVVRDLQGLVEAAGPSGEWAPVKAGQRLRAGQRIRTGEGAGAALVYFDGSRSQLASNAEVILARVNGGLGKRLHVTLHQASGSTSHSVVPRPSDQSTFVVYTPSGAASVHGTEFDVNVSPTGDARFEVGRGRVLVSSELGQVFLDTGQATKTLLGGDLYEPAYDFELEGFLESKNLTTWIVDDVTFTVLSSTEVHGGPVPGDYLKVDGRVMSDGAWVADLIQVVSPGSAGVSSFTGIVQSMEGEAWQVSGWSLLVDGGTQLDQGLAVDQTVRVTFTILEDGRWKALSIEKLEGEADQPGEPLPTAVPGADPVLALEPDELSAEACSAGSASFSGTLYNVAPEADDAAANVSLAWAVVQGHEWFNSASLEPGGWDSIPAGGSVTFKLSVDLDDAAWQNAPEGSEVKVRVFIGNEANSVEPHAARLTATLVKDCGDVQETPAPVTPPAVTPAVTQTPGVTNTTNPEVTITPQVVVTDTIDTEIARAEEDGLCTGAQPHPTGWRLAKDWGVSYEEIMGWFCDGFGFGEIELAYELSDRTGSPVSTYFDMKRSGLGWGEIKKRADAEALVDPLSTEDDRPGKGPDKDPNQHPSNKPGKKTTPRDSNAPGSPKPPKDKKP